jgi:hypothetical protein
MMSIGSEREGGKEGRSSRRKVIRARDLDERCWMLSFVGYSST